MRCLRFVLVLAILLLLSVVPALAQEGENIFADPDGQFTVVVPTNWQAQAETGYVTLSDPDGKITVYVLTLKDDDLKQAATDAWKRVKPDFVFEPEQYLEVPSARGVEKTAVLTQISDDKTRVYQAYVQLVGGVVYVQLFDADIVAAQQRAAQLQVIASGLTLNTVTETDLVGIEPLKLTPELIAELETYIGQVMEKLKIPGAAVAVVQDGEIVYEQGFGVRELGRDTPVTPATRMMIGSTGKSLTTLMMATIVDDGLMDWDTPVVDILPTFAVSDPELTKTITMRNLVCACTGVPRRDLEWLFNTNTPQQIVESLAEYRFFTDFGEAFQYSNQMVATGGYVATIAAGGSYDSLLADYAEQLQQRVLNPIGMTDTTLSFDEVEASGDYATPHGANLFGDYYPLPLSIEELLIPVAPAGAHWSTAHDMALYMLTELNRGVSPDGERIVSDANLEVTWQPQVEVSAQSSYGLGWFIDEYKGLRLIEHAGNTFGFTSEFAFLPDSNLGIVVLTNARASNLFNQAVRVRLLELLFQQEPEYDAILDFTLEQVQTSLEKLQGQVQDGYDVEAIQRYLSTFTNELLGDIIISEQEGKLMFDAGEFMSELRISVDDEGETRYLLADAPLAGVPLEFTEDNGVPVITLDIVTDAYTFKPAAP